MARRVLEINDVALTVADAGGTLARSPGQIICGEGVRKGMLAGRAASERRRINPRATHDRFWSTLDRVPLSRPAGPAKSNVDLAWLHLRELLASLNRGDEDAWILVVPATMDDDQLSLLLGIAHNLELHVEWLVSAPVATAVAAGVDDDSIIVDGHWHHFSADAVAMAGDTLRLEPTGAVEGRGPGGRGLGALFDTWADLVNDAFVTQTRFDPSHDAAVEQRLYNRLPDWLARMAQDEDVAAELDIGEHRYRAELSAEAFVDAAAPFYRLLTDRIARAGSGKLVLRHRIAGLPGLAQGIAGAASGAPCWLDEHAVARAVLELPRETTAAASDAAVPLIVEWPTGEPPRSDIGQPSGLDPVRTDHFPDYVPSHVLVDGRALAISEAGRDLTEHWRLEPEVDGRVVLIGDPAYPAVLNDSPAGERSRVRTGDRVVIGQREFTLLRVENHGSA